MYACANTILPRPDADTMEAISPEQRRRHSHKEAGTDCCAARAHQPDFLSVAAPSVLFTVRL